jgi:hypothetical protein
VCVSGPRRFNDARPSSVLTDQEDTTYYKHKAGAPTKETKKAAAAKRVRFDVEAQLTIPQLQKAAAAGKKRSRSDSLGASSDAGDEAADSDSASDDDMEGRLGLGAMPLLPPRPAASLGELRARLRAKIEAMRVARKAPPGLALTVPAAADDDDEEGGSGGKERPGPAGELQAEAKEARDARKLEKAARKKLKKKKAHAAKAPIAASSARLSPSPSTEQTAPLAASASAKKKPRLAAPPAGSASTSSSSSVAIKRGGDVGDDIDIAFGTFDTGAAAPAASSVRPAASASASIEFALAASASSSGPKPAASGATGGGGKVGKLRRMLAIAQKAQVRLEKAKAAGGGIAEASAVGAAFDSALRRAGGEVVRDDPKLIAKSLKRIEKDKAKSTAAWQVRSLKRASF